MVSRVPDNQYMIGFQDTDVYRKPETRLPRGLAGVPQDTPKERKNMAKAKGIPLTSDLVKRMKLDARPAGVDAKGKMILEANPDGKEYFVFCSDQNSPKGFGLRVAAKTGKKTWVVQRRVGDKIVRSKVGDCADWPLDKARERAAEMAREITSTGLNPNETARKIAASEITVGMAMDGYKHHLKTRVKKRAKPNTISNFERAERRFKALAWWDRRVRDIPTAEVLEGFKQKMETAPTCNEQNFTWLSLSIRHALDQEALDAAAANRDPTLAANPLKILQLKGMYRPAAEVEAQREANNSRNPLGPTTTLGVFLEAAWARRPVNSNATGIDFCIVELLVGARRGELGTVRWGEMLSQTERDAGAKSHVWIDEGGDYGPYIFFDADSTKNRRAHRMPMGPFLVNLLKRRRDEAAQASLDEGFGRKGREWVFPARNKFSSKGYYHDAGYLLDAIAAEVGIEFLNPHDLRRSMGAVLVALQVPDKIQSKVFNHTSAASKDGGSAGITARYSVPEWILMREWAEKVQEYILATAPNVYNSLLPAGRPMLPPVDPHVPTPPKPRTGRPRKEYVRELVERDSLEALEGCAGLG